MARTEMKSSKKDILRDFDSFLNAQKSVIPPADKHAHEKAIAEINEKMIEFGRIFNRQQSKAIEDASRIYLTF